MVAEDAFGRECLLSYGKKPRKLFIANKTVFLLTTKTFRYSLEKKKITPTNSVRTHLIKI